MLCMVNMSVGRGQLQPKGYVQLSVQISQVREQRYIFVMLMAYNGDFIDDCEMELLGPPDPGQLACQT